MGISSLPWQPRSINGQVLSKALCRAGPEASGWQEGATPQVPVHEHVGRGWRRTNLQDLQRMELAQTENVEKQKEETKTCFSKDAAQLHRFKRYTQIHFLQG